MVKDTTKTTEEQDPAEKKPAKKVAKSTAEKKPRAKKVEEKVEVQPIEVEEVSSGNSYIFGLGRRKRSIARVRLIKNGKGLITVNGRPMDGYFTTFELRAIVNDALKITGQETAVDVSSQVEGGGIRGQAEAVRLGLARALVELNPTYRKTLKKLGYLTRDARKKERKKFGLKKARRAPQWSKR